MDHHSQDEIRAYVQPVLDQSYSVAYSTQPGLQGPAYEAGELSAETQQGAVNVLNAMRYVAGIPYDVQIKDEYCQMAQAGALVNAVNSEMSHTPAKPSDMDDDLFELGYVGCSSSNLAWNAFNLKMSVMLWISDTSNASGNNPGHRRWCLNPSMQYTGFGSVGAASAMYAFDQGNWSGDTYSGVAWPAQNHPLQWFNAATQWSVSFGKELNQSEVTVSLTRRTDGKTWNFSDGSSDGQFFVDNGGYGQKGCVVFKPDNVGEYKDRDVFHVEIRSGNEILADYDVNFFDLYPVEKIEMEKTEISLEPGDTASLNAYIWPGSTTTKLNWEIADETIVKVTSDSGVYQASNQSKRIKVHLTGLKEGRTEITGTAANGMKVSLTVTVTDAKQDISKMKISLAGNTFTYTGKAIEPKVTINGLTEGKDFTVSYQNNTNAGTATVQICGAGAYSGNVKKTFQITRRSIDSSDITVTLSEDGKTPKIQVKGLSEGNDYTYSVSASGDTVQVTIKGIGNYSGTVKKTVAVTNTGEITENTEKDPVTEPAKVSKPIKAKITKLTTNKKHQIKVTWKKQKAAGYQVCYSTTKAFKTKTRVLIKNSKTTSKTISKLKKGKTYYVKVRAYKVFDGKRVYGSFSTVKKIKCK